MNILDHLLAWTSRSFFRNRALTGRTAGSQKKEIVNLVLGVLHKVCLMSSKLVTK